MKNVVSETMYVRMPCVKGGSQGENIFGYTVLISSEDVLLMFPEAWFTGVHSLSIFLGNSNSPRARQIRMGFKLTQVLSLAKSSHQIRVFNSRTISIARLSCPCIARSNLIWAPQFELIINY